MEAQFWLDRWNEGKIGFHRDQFNELLLQHFPALKADKGQRVLVPLCGKTKDLIWLQQQGLVVHGVELSPKACQAFFTENQLTPYQKTPREDSIQYSIHGLQISCGDLFKISFNHDYDFIYDRASLVALPSSMRAAYAQVMTTVLKPQGKYLLLAFEYDQAVMEGPPFSIDGDEVKRLFTKNFDIEMVGSEKIKGTGPNFEAGNTVKQVVYILTRKTI